jgi:hypothetical protein
MSHPVLTPVPFELVYDDGEPMENFNHVSQMTEAWVAWEEGGRLPDLIVELLSPSTERVDRKTKMSLYAQVFRTRDYFLFDWDKETLEGYRLVGNAYEPIAPDRQGRLRSAVLGLDLGLWQGVVRAFESGEAEESTWVRLFDPADRLIPTLGEAESARADAERARADAAEAELKRLRSLLGGLAE